MSRTCSPWYVIDFSAVVVVACLPALPGPARGPAAVATDRD